MGRKIFVGPAEYALVHRRLLCESGRARFSPLSPYDDHILPLSFFCLFRGFTPYYRIRFLIQSCVSACLSLLCYFAVI